MRCRRVEFSFCGGRFYFDAWARLARWTFLRLAIAGSAMPHFARGLVGAAGGCLFQFVGLFLVFEFQEVRYIEEGVALEADVDKCRLHAGQDARDSAVVYGTSQRIFVFTFVINFRELIVFKNCQPGFMRRA